MQMNDVIMGSVSRIERCAFITCSEWEKVIIWGKETEHLTPREIDICRSISMKKHIGREPTHKQAWTGLKVFEKYCFFKKVSRSLVQAQIQVVKDRLQELRQKPGISAEDYMRENLVDLEATLKRISHKI